MSKDKQSIGTSYIVSILSVWWIAMAPLETKTKISNRLQKQIHRESMK